MLKLLGLLLIAVCVFIYLYRDEISINGSGEGENAAVEIDFDPDDFDLEDVKGIGPKTKEKLEDAFDSVEDLYEATEEELEEFLSSKKVQRLKDYLESKVK